MTGYKLIFLFFLLSASIFADSAADSLDVSSASIADSTITDTTSATLSYSKKAVLKEVSYKKSPVKKDLNSIFSILENFYIYTPESYKEHYELNDFTLNHKNFSQSLYQLLYQPFYGTTKSRFITDFRQRQYTLPVSIANSYAGIGSTDMNYVFLSFYKGAILKHLNLNFAYLGNEGNWNFTNSKSKNFHFFATYNLPFASISYSNDFFDRKIPNFYIKSQADSFKSIPLKLSSHEFHIDSKIADIGMKTVKYSYDDTTSYSYQSFIKKRINYAFGFIEPKYELIKTDSSFISFKTLFNYADIYSTLHLNYLYGKELYLSSYNKYNIANNYSAIAKFISDNIYEHYNKIYLGNRIDKIGTELFLGRTSEDDFHTFFADVSQDKIFHIKDLSLDIKNRIILNKDTNARNPFVEFANSSELIYYLHYDNSIRIGLEYNLLSYDKDMEIYDLFLNAHIGIGITKYFNLQIDFINLTNQYSYYMLSQDAFHVNIGFNWIFLN